MTPQDGATPERTAEQPLVSIGMPIFNGEEFLRRTLDSLLVQDCASFELVICDNASTDGTASICLEYAARDPRIRYERNESNIGGLLNSKKVFDLSRGTYFMWAACHDLWEPTYISECLPVLERRPEVVLCYTGADWIDVEGRSLGDVEGRIDTRGLGRLARSQVVLWGLQNGAPIFGLMRSEALRKVALGTRQAGPDMTCLFELSLLGEFVRLPQRLFHFRQLADIGSMETYLGKMVGRDVSGKEALEMYRAMVREHLGAVRRQVPGLSLRIQLMILVYYTIYRKYAWLRRGIGRLP